jgi:NAD(P)-dependent dehydrogenase (short-subunit alcohol dehydrogenase family)
MADTVFITGADKGLGHSLAARFLREGSRVYAGLHRPETASPDLGRSFPESYFPIPLDVASLDSVRAAAELVAESAGALDLLINNAGVLLEARAPLAGIDLSSYPLRETMDVNAFGPLRVARHFLPLLEKGGRKLVINISSEAGSIADCWRESEFAYSMSKAALNMLSRILQNHLGPRGFKVLAVHPGWMRTDMGGAAADIEADEAAEGVYRLALREWGPDDPIYMDYRGRPLPW